MTKGIWTKIAFILIILLSILTNFFNLEKTHLFSWDQQRDAEVVYERMIQEKSPTLIGPRVVGPEGFHVGPMHYYILLPFYAATGGDPIAGPIAAGLIGVITTIGYIFVTQKLFNDEAAIVAGIISALAPQLTAWNVMYMPLFTILMYFALDRILNKKYSYLILAFATVVLGLQAHFSAVYFVMQLVVVLALLIHKNKWKLPKKTIRPSIIGLGILVLSFAPLIIFDVRHDFINTKLFIEFFTQNREEGILDITRAFEIFVRNTNMLGFLHNATATVVLNTTLLAIAILEGFRLFKKSRAKLVNLVTWIGIPFVTLSLYSGTISEYYFVTITSILPLLVGSFVAYYSKKSKPILIVTLILIGYILYGNVTTTLARDYDGSLYYKHNLVKYIADQNDEFFSLDYNVPVGHNFGFGYLLRYNGLIHDDTKPIPKYIIRIPPEEKDNDLPEEEFGVYKLSKKIQL